MNRNDDTSNHSNQNQNLDGIAFTSIMMQESFEGVLGSGASHHFCQWMEGLTDVRDIDEPIKIGNGGTMRATKIGNLKCEVTQSDGNKFLVSINDVKFVPNLCVNLFSLNKALKKGFIINNDANIVSLTLKQVRLTFDCTINAADSCVVGASMQPLPEVNVNYGVIHPAINNQKTLDINYLHKLFGHCGQGTLNKTIKMYGIEPSGVLET
jgi:hypothetical protein